MEAASGLRGFQVLGKLGEGAFGQVFKVRRRADDCEYALKKVRIGAMKEKQRENALNQIRILASIESQYIIRYKEAFYDEPSLTLCIVMQFASEGDVLKAVQDHLKKRSRFKEEELWKALVEMTQGLKSLHDRNVLHRDLKCANVFVTKDKKYKLGDLNVSKVLQKDHANTQTGTPYYASPQVWKDKPYGAKSDIWSLGCVLYEMASLKPPFTAHNLEGLYKKVIAGLYQRIPSAYSTHLAEIIASMLQVDPKKRPSVEDILNNDIVRKRYNGQIQQRTEEQTDVLLKTIKYNPKNLTGLKDILPKSNYQQAPREVSSCKNSRKEVNFNEQIIKQILINEKKLKEFVEKKKSMIEQQRKKEMMSPAKSKSKDEFRQKRERAMSASKSRVTEVYATPRVTTVKANEQGREQNRKIGLPPKLPPRPQVPLNKANGLGPSVPIKKQQKLQPRDRSNSESCRSKSSKKVIYPAWWG